ncbi:MAG: ISAs1 family transposase [Candidatus Hodarchaeota archaeon]
MDWLFGKESWEKLNIIGIVECNRHIGDTTSTGVRYYISSIENNAKEFAMAVRGLWGIENSVHWVLDVVFREDESRMRKGHSAENFALIQRIDLNLLKQEKILKKGTETKRLRAGWDNDYLFKVLGA